MDSKLSIKVFEKKVDNSSWRMVLASLDNSFDLIEENKSNLEDIDKEKNLAYKHCGDARVL
jgi:hypothetical protein